VIEGHHDAVRIALLEPRGHRHRASGEHESESEEGGEEATHSRVAVYHGAVLVFVLVLLPGLD
jgi:hypothetical protein